MSVKTPKTGVTERTACILKALYYLDRNQRKAIFKTVDRSIVKAICECILNIIKGNVKISEYDRKSLSKHKKLLRKLGNPRRKTSWKHRKNILVQKGSGILPYIIYPVMSFLLSKLTE